MSKYEYVAVDVAVQARKGLRKDDLISERLNSVAAHGYRFVGMIPDGQYGGGHAVFEREVSE